MESFGNILDRIEDNISYNKQKGLDSKPLDRSKVMKMAWSLHRMMIKENRTNYSHVFSFGHCLSMAWEMLKTWSGSIGEKVIVSRTYTETTLNGRTKEMESKFAYCFNVA